MPRWRPAWSRAPRATPRTPDPQPNHHRPRAGPGAGFSVRKRENTYEASVFQEKQARPRPGGPGRAARAVPLRRAGAGRARARDPHRHARARLPAQVWRRARPARHAGAHRCPARRDAARRGGRPADAAGLPRAAWPRRRPGGQARRRHRRRRHELPRRHRALRVRPADPRGRAHAAHARLGARRRLDGLHPAGSRRARAAARPGHADRHLLQLPGGEHAGAGCKGARHDQRGAADRVGGSPRGRGPGRRARTPRLHEAAHHGHQRHPRHVPERLDHHRQQLRQRFCRARQRHGHEHMLPAAGARDRKAQPRR